MTSNDMITLRSWQQLSDEIQKRADAQRYPLTGMDPGDVTEALANTATLNRDAWANGWSVIGDRYLNLANKQVKSNRSLACSNYLNAWRYHGFAAWPTQNTDSKKIAFNASMDSFRSYASLVSPNIERIKVPFEDKHVIFYIQLPDNASRPVPLILSFGGLDSYKEYIVERYGPDYLANGFGYAALDIPGTGESPILASPDAIRMYKVIIE